jgi:photosystem II stability/assembly factor-like uncharacterized protein
MKLQDQHSSTEQGQAPPSRKSWLASIGAALTVLLIIGISIALFVSRGTSPHSATPGSATVTAPPPAGQWTNVENRYLFSTLEAAPNNPALIYACASPYPLQQGPSPHYTLLRSSDFGAHWQDLGKQVALRDFCQVTINPTNGNELYVVTAGTPTGNTTPDVLKHSSDGGKTWSTLQPQLDKQTSTTWHVQQLRMVGHDLFGIQWMSQLLYGSTQTPAAAALNHLLHSSDGGKTWTTIDNTLIPATWMIHAYVVDPSDTRTIYETAGPLPRVGGPGIANNAESNGTSQLTLYKTTDGGANWQPLLNNLLPSSMLQLASAKPNVLYIGETATARPLRDASVPQSNTLLTTRIRVSTDGGATWHDALQVYGGSGFVHGWFSSTNGQLYALVGVPSSTNSNVASIRGYDPTTSKWSEITKLPQPGDLLAVTDTGAGKGAVLWLRSFVGGKTALYRYVTQ